MSDVATGTPYVLEVETTEVTAEVTAEAIYLGTATEEHTLVLQAGTGPAGKDAVDSSFYEAENKGLPALFEGAVVTGHPSGVGVRLASALDWTQPAVGLVRVGAAAGFVALVQTLGVFKLADWTAVTGTPTLTPMAWYFLDAAAGRLSTTPQLDPGRLNHVVGRAVSPVAFRICPLLPIQM